jgi:hypothetical protein
MKFITILVTFFISLARHDSVAQVNSPIPGVWKGTSLCQIKNSPCHDENVVYQISKTNAASFNVLMKKIVNTKEEQIGTMVFEYDSIKQTLSSKDTVHNAEWVFNLKGKQIKGTLVYKGKLYRIIDVKKEN